MVSAEVGRFGMDWLFGIFLNTFRFLNHELAAFTYFIDLNIGRSSDAEPLDAVATALPFG